VFLATILLGDKQAAMDDVALLLAIEPSVVLNVVNGPQQLLFCMQEGDGKMAIWSALHHSWFDTSYSSGRFCISTGEIDALLISILARVPPAEAQKSYCWEDLTTVIRTVLTFNGLHSADIPSASGLQSSVVDNVIRGPHQVLFRSRLSHCFPPVALRSFFHNSHRSGELYISRDDLDAFLIHYLSRPPPVDPGRSYSRQCLMDVLRFLFVSQPPSALKRIELYNVASKLNVSHPLVCNVVFGAHATLFDVELDQKMKSHWVSFESRVTDIKGFLLDPARSGEFYLGP